MTHNELVALRALLSEHDDSGMEGDDWIVRPDPDSAWLDIDSLVRALERFIDKHHRTMWNEQ